jgi:acyl-CoA synthetase (AMP-forming)/AMP-acid ligase II
MTVSTTAAPRPVREAAPRTVRELIDRAAASRPDAVYALATEHDERITYGALERSCRAVTAWLRRHGVGPGDTVSLVMPNGLGTVRLLLGALHGGVAVNPVNLLSQPEQMAYVLGHSDCRLVFVAPDWEARVRALVEGLGRAVRVVVADPDRGVAGLAEDAGGDARAGSDNDSVSDNGSLSASGFANDDDTGGTDVDTAASPPPRPEDLGLLMYTSGTTGQPKGVMLTQGNLAANALAISAEHGLGPGDRVLAVLPLYHINAFAVTMLAPLAHGGSLAMPPRFSAARFWGQAAASDCTWINVVPTMISYLLEGAVPPREQTARLRFCRSASAALPPEHLRAFEQKFGIGIVETMGLTETVAPAFSNPLEPARRKLGSVGRASGCEARVIDAALQPVADGTTGEIAIRGPNVMRGYYKNEAASAAAFTPDGWLRTGDLGHRDADGYFFVTGRIKELIIKGGENIAPREIDEALLGHPAVLDAAAVGIPDRHYGQEIMACVVLREGQACDEAELRRFCERALGPYKTPKVFRFVGDLPRGPSGKVQRLKLLDLLAP